MDIWMDLWMVGLVYGLNGRWICGCADAWMDGWIGGCVDVWMCACMDLWIDGWMLGGRVGAGRHLRRCMRERAGVAMRLGIDMGAAWRRGM